MPSITAANAVIMLAVPGVFPAPTPLQQFAAEDIFTNDPVQANEVAMGVDGYLAAGFVFNPVAWSVSLMADSPSNRFFDTWYQTMVQNVESYRCNGTIWLKGTNQKYDMRNGALTTYRNMPDAAKTLRSRAFVITWQSVTPAQTS
jgi:hypothetical protein